MIERGLKTSEEMWCQCYTNMQGYNRWWSDFRLYKNWNWNSFLVNFWGGGKCCNIEGFNYNHIDGGHTLGFVTLMAYFCTQYQNLLRKFSFSLETRKKFMNLIFSSLLSPRKPWKISSTTNSWKRSIATKFIQVVQSGRFFFLGEIILFCATPAH